MGLIERQKPNFAAPWHRISYRNFLEQDLPGLLADRLPLEGYHIDDTSKTTCDVTVSIRRGEKSSRLKNVYVGVPQPDDEGVFSIDGSTGVVVPTIASEQFPRDRSVDCVGDRLNSWFADRLTPAPPTLEWDQRLLERWLPLTDWILEFLYQDDGSGFQTLDAVNWLSKQTHLRRVSSLKSGVRILPHPESGLCPIEMPEGPRIGKILTLSSGTAIRDGSIVKQESEPADVLGLSASCIPLLEHDHGNRLLMGANMMRQWLPQTCPEPAWVKTGNEPDNSEFWCGHNLLTAFIQWDEDAYEDALVISESAARRFDSHWLLDREPSLALGFDAEKGAKFAGLEDGDKLSNRHGAKGVVSRIYPDSEMPVLPGGTPVELIMNPMSIVSRMNLGQVREAVLGRLTCEEGKPWIAPPFSGPSDEEIKKRLRAAGWAEDGMEQLMLNGKPFHFRSTVGWVYWGLTRHLSRMKLEVSTAPDGEAQWFGESDYRSLFDAGAWENAFESHHTRSAAHPDADRLAQSLSQGEIEHAAPPSPAWRSICERLNAGGIQVSLDGETVSCAQKPPSGPSMRLPVSVPHPWLPEVEINEVGRYAEVTSWSSFEASAERLSRAMSSAMPDSRLKDLRFAFEQKLRDFFGELLSPQDFVMNNPVAFSGRAVMTPGKELQRDQIGIPESMAIKLFGPFVARERRCSPEALDFSDGATRGALQDVMRRNLVLARRPGAPVAHRALLAYRPVLVSGNSIRVHSFVTYLMESDFDGDTICVYLPLTGKGQREAKERLTLDALLASDRDFVYKLRGPHHSAIWGLAFLALTDEGQRQIEDTLGEGPALCVDGRVLSQRRLRERFHTIQSVHGDVAMLDAMERLKALGMVAARTSGASIGPFIGETVAKLKPPATDDRAQWEAYADEVMSSVLSGQSDFDESSLGPTQLSVRCGARGNKQQLRSFVGPHGLLHGTEDHPVTHLLMGWRGGIPHEFFFDHVRRTCGGVVVTVERLLNRDIHLVHRATGTEYEETRAFQPEGNDVVARARRSRHPGVVFARAARQQLAERLRSQFGRIFVGLPFGATPE